MREVTIGTVHDLFREIERLEYEFRLCLQSIEPGNPGELQEQLGIAYMELMETVRNER